MKVIFTLAALAALALVGTAGFAQAAAPVGRAAQAGQANRGGARMAAAAALPADIRIIRDVAYGTGARQTFDVYAPATARAAPVIFMVHGGGWRRGDKAARGVIQNKVAHWLPRGFIFISVDYPLLPDAQPLQQAQFVAKALAAAQRDAAQWGGDPARFVLMGHSAGAHLVSLLAAEPSLAAAQGARPWLGTVALDSAAFNVVAIMQARHLPLYDEAFGADPAAWAAVSPLLQLRAKIPPFLAVCSAQRREACTQARAFAAKAKGFGARVEVLPEDLRHGAINAELGLDNAYTTRVDAFLASLDPVLAAHLRE